MCVRACGCVRVCVSACVQDSVCVRVCAYMRAYARLCMRVCACIMCVYIVRTCVCVSECV